MENNVNRYVSKESRLSKDFSTFVLHEIDDIVPFENMEDENWFECSKQMYFFLTGKGQ